MSWNFRHILTQPKVKTVLLVSVLISLTIGAAWFGSVSWIKTFFGSVCSRFCGHLESHLDMWSSWILCFSCQIAVQCALAGRHECQKYCCHVPIYTPYQWDERIPIGRILWIMAMLTEKHSWCTKTDLHSILGMDLKYLAVTSQLPTYKKPQGFPFFLIPKSLMSKVILLEVRVFRAMKKRSPVIVVSGTHLEQPFNLLLWSWPWLDVIYKIHSTQTKLDKKRPQSS